MIRLANENDLDELVKIENTMFDDKYYYKLSKQEIFKLLAKKSTIMYIWEIDFQIVGYALGIIVNKKNLWFNSLAVLKQWQSTNVAKELFKSIELYSSTNSFDSVILEIRNDNKALLRRYKGMGYCEWKQIPNYYPDGCSAIRMLKKR